eukprot:1195834-Prorocentrum_minimum.AAC.4
MREPITSQSQGITRIPERRCRRRNRRSLDESCVTPFAYCTARLAVCGRCRGPLRLLRSRPNDSPTPLKPKTFASLGGRMTGGGVRRVGVRRVAASDWLACDGRGCLIGWLVTDGGVRLAGAQVADVMAVADAYAPVSSGRLTHLLAHDWGAVVGYAAVLADVNRCVNSPAAAANSPVGAVNSPARPPTRPNVPTRRGLRRQTRGGRGAEDSASTPRDHERLLRERDGRVGARVWEPGMRVTNSAPPSLGAPLRTLGRERERVHDRGRSRDSRVTLV